MNRKNTHHSTRTRGYLDILFVLALFYFCIADAGSLMLTSPQDYQVVQRFAVDRGAVMVAGTVEGGKPSVIEARVVRGGKSGPWKRIPATIKGSSFQGVMTVPAGGWYSIDVRAANGVKILGEYAVKHVGVGEIFVVAGQSNSANYGEERQTSETGLAVAFNGKRWQVANDPQPGADGDAGSFLPPFGDAIAVKLGVPVGFVACGIGATSVREWLPEGIPFPNPPTLTGRVRQLPGGEWESNGEAFAALVSRMKALGSHGFRAVLWHQGESDANQPDPTRTLPGNLYRELLTRIIRETRKETGWDVPWFVAQASYHVPGDEASPDIRAAQKALWDDGIALEGPDTDILKGDLRQNGGKGVHFSDKGLKAHAARWVDRVTPWLQKQLSDSSFEKTLPLPGEVFSVQGHVAFAILPSASSVSTPWVWYAPTLPALPGKEEQWMFERFTDAGIAIAGIDVGESFGSPDGRRLFSELYNELTEKRGFSPKPVMLGRSRGGLMTLSWAQVNAGRVAAFAGIYPVCNIASYPGVEKASRAYRLSPEELAAHLKEYNPLDRLPSLAKAGVPLFAIHGDVDSLVPLEQNSAEMKRRYEVLGGHMQLVVPKGQGHNMWEGFFRSKELVDFVLKNAKFPEVRATKGQ
jgi:hypothetical protein